MLDLELLSASVLLLEDDLDSLLLGVDSNREIHLLVALAARLLCTTKRLGLRRQYLRLNAAKELVEMKSQVSHRIVVAYAN